MWEKDVNINEVKEILTKSKVFFGVGAIKRLMKSLKTLKKKELIK